MMNSLVRSVAPRVSRSFSTSWKAQIENRVKERQQLFQEPDGLPIHLKGGHRIRVTYKVTMVLAAGGSLWACIELLRLAFKKS